jgi:hypothetical protein
MLRIAKDAPRWKKSNTEIAEPRREKLLRDTAAPRLEYSKTERDAATRAMPKRENLDPTRHMLRRDKEAPRFVKP